MSLDLVTILNRRDRLSDRLVQKFDILTSMLKSLSVNIKGASTLRFSLAPYGGPDGFRPWLSAWRVISRVGDGVQTSWRRNLWSALVHYRLSHIEWSAILPGLFNKELTEEDMESNVAISKDLKSNLTANYANSDDEARLRSVLLAYTRYNRSVGYCQGFNILATVVLRVTNGDEELCLKILIYLIDHVFPKAFFAHKLEGLSVDITVFRDLMSFYLPELSQHLEGIREAAMKNLQMISGAGNYQTSTETEEVQSAAYEPPLTNLFTLQWFLTLFATVLPKETALRVWDTVFLEGSEVVFYTALVVWRLFQSDLLVIDSSADFYQTMSLLSAHLKKGKIVSSQEFMDLVYMYIDEVDNCELYSLPSPKDLRERYTYNITPLAEQPKILESVKSKKATPPPRLCPPPNRGASFMASWTLRLPQVKPATSSQIPQLHIDKNRSRGKRRSASTSGKFTSGGVKQGVVLESAEASLSSEYPQQSMEVEALLYAMEISDNVHHYSFKTTNLPQLGNRSSSTSDGRDGIPQGHPPTVQSAPTTPSSPNRPVQRKQNWRQSMPYSSVGELANFLLLQDQ
jgi:hypothetical protein